MRPLSSPGIPSISITPSFSRGNGPLRAFHRGMIETIAVTGVGSVAVSFMLIFFRALRRDARNPHIQLVRKRVMHRTISVKHERTSAEFCRAA